MNNQCTCYHLGLCLSSCLSNNQPEDLEAESGAVQYTAVQFADQKACPIAAPRNENFDVRYSEISKA